MREAVRWVEQQLPAMEAALAALVNVNSFTANPAGGREVGRLLDAMLALEGVEMARVASERFADHRVYRTMGRSDRRPVALIGHLDTVFPPGVFEGYRVDGALRRGPGVLDMKGGLVVVVWALKAIAATSGLSSIAPLRLVVVSDEEVGSPEGSLVLARELIGCRAALVFESGRANDEIVTRRQGTGAATIIAQGKAAHAGNAYWSGANAIWALARFVDAAQRLSSKEAGLTVNVGTVNGGTAKNTVPAEARAELDLRYPTAQARQVLLEQLERAASQAALDVPGTRVDVELGPSRLPMQPLEGTHALFESYAACARAHGLGAAEAPLQGGGSDGNTAVALGIPAIDALGPRGRHFHTPDEYIEVDSLVPRTAALIEWLGLA